MVTDLPTMAGSPPKRRFQSPAVMHRRAGAVALPLVARKPSSQLRPDPQLLQEPRRDLHAHQALRLARSGQRVADVAEEREVRRERLERPVVARQLLVGGDAVGLAAQPFASTGVGNPYQPVGIAKGQRLEHERVDDAEHRRIGADADRQNQDGDQRVPRFADQPAKRQSEIVEERLEGHERLRRRRGTKVGRVSGHVSARAVLRLCATRRAGLSRRLRPRRLEPVDAFADQVELQLVPARLDGRGNLDRDVGLLAAFEMVGQPRPRVVAVDQRAVGRAQLRAQAHEPAAVAGLRRKRAGSTGS